MDCNWIKVDNWKDIPKNVIGVYRLVCSHNKVYIGMSEKSIYNRWYSYSRVIWQEKPKMEKQWKLQEELLKCFDFDKWTHEYIELPFERIRPIEINLIDKLAPDLNIFNHRFPIKMINLKTNEEIIVLGFQNVMNYFDKDDPIRFKHPNNGVLRKLGSKKYYYESDWRVKDSYGEIIDTHYSSWELQEKVHLEYEANLLEIERNKIDINLSCHFCNIEYGKIIRINPCDKDKYKYWFCKECLALKKNWKVIRKLKGFDWWAANIPKQKKKK